MQIFGVKGVAVDRGHGSCGISTFTWLSFGFHFGKIFFLPLQLYCYTIDRDSETFHMPNQLNIMRRPEIHKSVVISEFDRPL